MILDRPVAPGCTEAGQPAFCRRISQNDRRFTDEIQHRYGETEPPVRICWGSEDTGIPVARGHEPASLVPGSGLRLIEGAGRLVREDAPAELTAALTRFPRTPPAPGPRTAP